MGLSFAPRANQKGLPPKHNERGKIKGKVENQRAPVAAKTIGESPAPGWNLSGHYSRDRSEYVNVMGVISEPFPHESTL